MKLSLLMATVLMRQQPLQRTLVTIQRTFDDFANTTFTTAINNDWVLF
jgi:hypothetical protein